MQGAIYFTDRHTCTLPPANFNVQLVPVSQEYLAKHDADIAAAALVKACSLSTITLGLFDEHTTNWDSLLTKLQLANTRCMLTCNDMIA